MGIRKTIAGWFIRTGQRIYRPTITDMTAEFDELLFVRPGADTVRLPLYRFPPGRDGTSGRASGALERGYVAFLQLLLRLAGITPR